MFQGSANDPAIAYSTAPINNVVDDLNRRLGSRAFAFGDHICFAEAAYQPRTEAGLRLLAHELAHVVQQRLGRTLGEPSRLRPALPLRLARG